MALAIAEAAHRLNQLRENWLHPAEWVDRVSEVVHGYPDLIIPKPDYAGALQECTLTNLGSQRQTWLENVHAPLVPAAGAAYGWLDYTPEMTDDDILAQMLAVNLVRVVA